MKKKKEIDRIAMGSVDIYLTEWEGTSVDDIPADEVLEVESNLIGRTKDGGTITYTPTFYTAKSDDGEAKRTELTEEEVKVSFGVITWNGDTVSKLVPTASVTVKDGKRRTEIGGIKNNDDKTYLFRAVHKDKVKGDVRYTFIGRNTQGFAAAYKKGQESVITPEVETDPFDNGRLLIMDESDIDTTEPAETTAQTQSVAKTTAKNTAS